MSWPKDVEYHKKRQEEIEKGGWKFFRYNKLPSDNELCRDLEGYTNGSYQEFSKANV